MILEIELDENYVITSDGLILYHVGPYSLPKGFLGTIVIMSESKEFYSGFVINEEGYLDIDFSKVVKI